MKQYLISNKIDDADCNAATPNLNGVTTIDDNFNMKSKTLNIIVLMTETMITLQPRH